MLVVCLGLLSMTATTVQAATLGGWTAPSGYHQVPIWPNGPPDMAGVSLPTEHVELTKAPDVVAGRPYTSVYDVTSPTMTIFPARGKNTGVSMVVFPGGGFQLLAIDLEGTEVCDWMTSKGITCALLKYRVPNSNAHYDSKCDCQVTPRARFSLQDAQRAIKLLRAKAYEYQINPHKIGVIGFSAGGYLVAETSNVFDSAYKAVDAIDKVSSRPDFAVDVYGGHIWRGKGWDMDPSLHVTKNTPPTFIVQAWDDKVDGVRQGLIYAHALEDAGAPAEVHLFAKGGHAFGLRRTQNPITEWPALVEAWLKEIGIL